MSKHKKAKKQSPAIVYDVKKSLAKLQSSPSRLPQVETNAEGNYKSTQLVNNNEAGKPEQTATGDKIPEIVSSKMTTDIELIRYSIEGHDNRLDKIDEKVDKKLDKENFNYIAAIIATVVLLFVALVYTLSYSKLLDDVKDNGKSINSLVTSKEKNELRLDKIEEIVTP